MVLISSEIIAVIRTKLEHRSWLLMGNRNVSSNLFHRVRFLFLISLIG
jgi:hypothetical protein